MLFGTKPKQIGGLLGMMAAPQQTPMQQAPLLGALGQPDRMAMFEQPQQPMGQPMSAPMQAGMQRFTQPQQPQGGGHNWGRILVDAAYGALGQEGPFAQQADQRRMLAERQRMAAQQAQIERQQGMEDWQAKEMWKRQNPEPHYNDTQADLEYYKSLSPQDQAIYDRLHPITVMGPDGPYAVPRSALGQTVPQAAPSTPTTPVGKLTPIGGGVSDGTGGFPKVGKATGFQSYNSGSYGPLEEAAGREFGVPPEMLYRVRTRGERSNSNQVSEVGARSVYQVTPQTRQLIIKQYGFDPWSSPQNSARGASIVLRDMYRKFGNWDDAMTGYHGGGDTRNWGPRTRAYRQRTRTNRGN